MNISFQRRVRASLLSLIVLLGVVAPLALMNPERVEAVAAGNTYIRDRKSVV